MKTETESIRAGFVADVLQYGGGAFDYWESYGAFERIAAEQVTEEDAEKLSAVMTVSETDTYRDVLEELQYVENFEEDDEEGEDE